MCDVFAADLAACDATEADPYVAVWIERRHDFTTLHVQHMRDVVQFHLATFHGLNFSRLSASY